MSLRRHAGWLLVLFLAAVMLAAYLAPLAQTALSSVHPMAPSGIDWAGGRQPIT